MVFVFYDLETTGIAPACDQPLQFAAIRTDDDFLLRSSVSICDVGSHRTSSRHRRR